MGENNGTILKEVDGIIWGSSFRPMVNLPVKLRLKKCPIPLNVIFMVDISSPETSLTEETI